MPKRKPHELRKQILLIIREKPLSYTKIQTKLSTNYDSVKNNCEELETYGLLKIEKIEKHPENGNPSYDVKITDKGYDVIKRFKERLS